MNISGLQHIQHIAKIFDTSHLIQLLTSLRDDGPDAAALDPMLVDVIVDIDAVFSTEVK